MPELLGTSGVAKELDISQRWVNELLNSGQLKGVFVGNRWLITREDLEAYKRQKEAIEASKKAD